MKPNWDFENNRQLTVSKHLCSYFSFFYWYGLEEISNLFSIIELEAFIVCIFQLHTLASSLKDSLVEKGKEMQEYTEKHNIHFVTEKGIGEQEEMNGTMKK